MTEKTTVTLTPVEVATVIHALDLAISGSVWATPNEALKKAQTLRNRIAREGGQS